MTTLSAVDGGIVSHVLSRSVSRYLSSCDTAAGPAANFISHLVFEGFAHVPD